MNEYIPIASLVLNILVLPLLAMQWRTRVVLATMTAQIVALSAKVDTADAEIKQLRQRMHDALNHITELKAIISMRKKDR